MDLGFVVLQYSGEKVEFARKAGFDCLEVFVDSGGKLDLDNMSSGQLAETLEFFNQNGIKFGTIACCPNHLVGDPDKRRANNEYFIKALKTCRKFGTNIVMTNAWADINKSPEENLKTYKDVFSEYARVAEGEGVLIALVLAYLWKNTGYYTIIYYTGLMSIDKEYFEAGAIDGAGEIKKIRYISLPFLSPIMPGYDREMRNFNSGD